MIGLPLADPRAGLPGSGMPAGLTGGIVALKIEAEWRGA